MQANHFISISLLISRDCSAHCAGDEGYRLVKPRVSWEHVAHIERPGGTGKEEKLLSI